MNAAIAHTAPMKAPIEVATHHIEVAIGHINVESARIVPAQPTQRLQQPPCH